MFITISSLARTVELGGARPAVIGEPVVDARVASAPVVPQAAVRRLDRCGGADSLTAAEYAARLGLSHLAFEVLPRPAGIDPSLDQPTAGRAPRTGDGAARGQAGGAPGAGEGEASTARELAYALLDHSFAGCLAAAACTTSLDLSHG